MFDPSKPFGTVHGHEFAVYEQDGKCYNSQKEEINIDTGEVIQPEEMPVDLDFTNTAEDESEGQEQTDPDISESVDQGDESEQTASGAGDTTNQGSRSVSPSSPDLESAHWTVLKKMVIDAGGEYVNNKEAIAYLRSLG